MPASYSDHSFCFYWKFLIQTSTMERACKPAGVLLYQMANMTKKTQKEKHGDEEEEEEEERKEGRYRMMIMYGLCYYCRS